MPRDRPTPLERRDWGLSPRFARRLVAVAAAVGCAVFALHAANLVHRARSEGCLDPGLRCRSERGVWGAATGDFRTYRRVARQIVYRGVLGTSYYQRTPGYPLLIALSYRGTGSMGPVRWVGPVLAGLAAAAVAWLAGHWAGSIGAAWLAGALFALWPNLYQFSSDLRPDGSHAFLAITALAATVAWRHAERRPAAGLAALAWAGAQALRPTFFALPLILPLLLLRRGAGRRRAAGSALLWAATCIVPAFVVGSNGLRHGAFVPTRVASHTLACYAVPRLWTEQGHGTFHENRRWCKAQIRRLPGREQPAAEVAFALRAFRRHPLDALRSFAGETRRQLLHPSRIAARPGRHALAGVASVGSGGMIAFWLAACGGALLVARRDRALGAFLAGAVALVLLPAATSHLVGDRLRLPVDLLALPLVAVFLAVLAAAAQRRLRDSRDLAAPDPAG